MSVNLPTGVTLIDHPLVQICLVSCPQGLAQLRGAHPDVEIFTAAVDPGLNDKAYIVPGLGDAGDCYFGTAG